MLEPGKKAPAFKLPADDGSYRVYTFPWSATPTTPPDVAARRSAGGTDVYASWNGATTVARWQVLGGATTSTLHPLATVPRRGFETRIAVSSAPAVVSVRALGAGGRVLAQSPEVQPS